MFSCLLFDFEWNSCIVINTFGEFGGGWKISAGMTFYLDDDNEIRDFDGDGEYMVMIVMNFNDSDMISKWYI